jgi:hypothetical protein
MSLTRDAGCPEDVLMAIAWYPEGLDAEARGAVEAHAADCAACREEIAFVCGEASPELPREESERVYTRVMQRIEAYEEGQRAGRAAVARGARRAFARPGLRAAALLLAACAGAAAAIVGMRLGPSGDAVYRTASGTPDVSAAGPARAEVALDVVFQTDATAEHIHEALRAIGGEIVSGPTQLGVYRVRLAPSADAGAAAKVLRGEGKGVATFAELAPR